MFHAKDVLSDQLLANANDPSWYLPFSDSVENLSEEEAFWKPNENCNSIAEIVQHLLYWNETWQTRYQKSHVNAVPSIGDNNKSFIIPENKSFSNLKERLLEVLLQWQDLLTEEKVESEVNGFLHMRSGGRYLEMYPLITHITLVKSSLFENCKIAGK